MAIKESHKKIMSINKEKFLIGSPPDRKVFYVPQVKRSRDSSTSESSPERKRRRSNTPVLGSRSNKTPQETDQETTLTHPGELPGEGDQDLHLEDLPLWQEPPGIQDLENPKLSMIATMPLDQEDPSQELQMNRILL